MALGIKTESASGDIMPIVKYDARAGRAMRVDRRNDGGSWAAETTDITSNFKAVVDLENIEVGWMNFNTGGAPDFRLVELGDATGERPGENYREGFRLMLKLAKEAGGDVREFCSVAKVVIRALDELHDAYNAGVKANPGKLPIVALKGTKPVVSGSGQQKSTNYQPVFEITGWAARPPDLVFRPKAKAAGGGHAASAAAPKPADTDGEDFG